MLHRRAFRLRVWDVQLKSFLTAHKLDARGKGDSWPSTKTTREKASPTDIARIGEHRSRHILWGIPVPTWIASELLRCWVRLPQPGRIPSGYWVIPAITIQIGSASKTDRVRLEESAD